MDLFSALSDPTRRNIVELLAVNGQLSATDISDKFHVSPPAISQHLKVLREADLVQVEKRAQKRIYTINTDSLQKLEDWTRKMKQLWSQRFDVMDKVLAAEKQKGVNKYDRKQK
ncbi:winged helix-turn-helix transcriptional regulator [Candidatus Microgenomates bacterium]|nr:winged helix-turn-helix transcriptional regulator [Candidatus Microgenomates bacterium]